MYVVESTHGAATAGDGAATAGLPMASQPKQSGLVVVYALHHDGHEVVWPKGSRAAGGGEEATGAAQGVPQVTGHEDSRSATSAAV